MNDTYEHASDREHDSGDERGDYAEKCSRRRSIFWGLTLVTLGVFFTVDQLDIFETTELLRDWWPLILIAFGIYSRGYILTGIGVWLLISELGLYGLTYSTSWPVILIVAGAGIVLQALVGGSPPRHRHRHTIGEERR